MNQTISPITEIKNQFPQVEYFTTLMVAMTAQQSRQQVCKYCRQLWPRHEGQWRFWNDYEEREHQLNLQNLERLLRLIRQNKTF